MNELLAKIRALSQQIESRKAQAESLLVKAEADGTSAEDRAKFLAESDKIQAEIKPILAEATALQERVNLLTAAGSFVDGEHRKPVVVTPPRGPHQSPDAGRQGIPTGQRRPAKLKAFKSNEEAYQAGLWIAATFYGHVTSRTAHEERYGPLAATLSTTSNGGAAYFVPDVIETAVIELTEQFGVARRLCDVQPMSSDTWSGPRWTGSIATYFVAEGSAPTQSEPTWDMVSLVAKNLAAYGKMTRNLSEDAIIDLAEKWVMYAAIALANKEDDCLFNGDGTSTYGGITGLLTKIVLSANSASLSTATGHTTLGALTNADYLAVVGKFPNYPGAQPAWLCHKEIWANSMAALQLASGGATPADIAAGGRPTFMGYPVEFVNVMPRAASVTTGVTGILFADLRLAAKFGDRRGRTFESGMINDDMIKQLMTLFVSERFDINAHSITDPKDSTKPGPVIGLKLG